MSSSPAERTMRLFVFIFYDTLSPLQLCLYGLNPVLPTLLFVFENSSLTPRCLTSKLTESYFRTAAFASIATSSPGSGLSSLTQLHSMSSFFGGFMRKGFQPSHGVRPLGHESQPSSQEQTSTAPSRSNNAPTASIISSSNPQQKRSNPGLGGKGVTGRPYLGGKGKVGLGGKGIGVGAPLRRHR